MRISIKDYRTKEGIAARNMGYDGPNPYPENSESAQKWADGYASNTNKKES